MKSKSFWWLALVLVVVVVVAMSLGAMAQQLSGTINDYTPATITVPPNSLGPWEIRGEWTLKVKGDSGKADFSAVLNMVRSDYWVLQNGNPDDPDARDAHTHHIALVDGDVTPLAHGFRVTGTAAITGNGNPAKFGLLSPLQVDVTGGSLVRYSNINLTFGSPASGHLGTQPLSGIVRGKMTPNDDVTLHPTAWVTPATSVCDHDCMGDAKSHCGMEHVAAVKERQ